MGRMMLLADMTDAMLIEELARRARKRAREKPDDAPWCHDCGNFACKADATDDYNPCKIGHKMKFKAPEDMGEASSGEHGFYRIACGDRI